jgi:hypothetical protein
METLQIIANEFGAFSVLSATVQVVAILALENWSLFVAVVAAYYVLSVLRINKIVG